MVPNSSSYSPGSKQKHKSTPKKPSMFPRFRLHLDSGWFPHWHVSRWRQRLEIFFYLRESEHRFRSTCPGRSAEVFYTPEPCRSPTGGRHTRPSVTDVDCCSGSLHRDKGEKTGPVSTMWPIFIFITPSVHCCSVNMINRWVFSTDCPSTSDGLGVWGQHKQFDEAQAEGGVVVFPDDSWDH